MPVCVTHLGFEKVPFQLGAAFFCVHYQAVTKNMHKFENNCCAVLLRGCTFASMEITKKQFSTFEAARDFAAANNKGRKSALLCVVPFGACFAVVDHGTAIDLGTGYIIPDNYRALNPWEA